MSNVIMTLRVMPSGLEVDLDSLKMRIAEALKGVIDGDAAFKKQPIAFGLNAWDVAFVVSEENGNKAEEALKGLEGVQSVNTQSVSLV